MLEATNGWALQLPKLQSTALQKSGATTDKGANHDGKTSKQFRKKLEKKKKRKKPHDKIKKRQKASMSPSIVRITSPVLNAT